MSAVPTETGPGIRAGDSWPGRSTHAVVDLDAIAANVRALKQCAGIAQLMTVVKGNAYGHGATMVSRTALANGATWLGVFTVDEGVSLRHEGVQAPILVLGPFSDGEADALVGTDLTPTVSTVQQAEALQRASNGRTIAFHLEIDTGMTRGGLFPRDALHLLESIQHLTALSLSGLFTHFAGADEPGEASAVRQLAVFHVAVELVIKAGYPAPLTHAANSAATMHFPDASFDMVRTGISTYGYFPSRIHRPDVQLEPALSLLSEVSRVSHVPKGTGIGYGHDFRCTRPTTVALAPVGYADGLHRSLGNERGTALVRGHQVPIVGRVSMDQITLDVTDVPGVQAGDGVVLIGKQGSRVQTAETLARQAGTISYEILAAILPRVPRLYREGGRVVGSTTGDRYVSFPKTTGHPSLDLP
ncbi:MAG: alanine racemase [Chloroflexota bacterium]